MCLRLGDQWLVNARLQKLNINHFNQSVSVHILVCTPKCMILKELLES